MAKLYFEAEVDVTEAGIEVTAHYKTRDDGCTREEFIEGMAKLVDTMSKEFLQILIDPDYWKQITTRPN